MLPARLFGPSSFHSSGFIEGRRLCDLSVVTVVQYDIRSLDPINTFADAVDNMIAINLLKEELLIAHIFSSDAVQAHAQNPDINFFIPNEGGLIWTDNFAIPSSSQHKIQAHTFINFFLDPENALSTVKQSHLATPNKTVKSLLGPEETNNPNIYPPPETFSKLFFLEDLGEHLPVMNRMWTELKS